MGCNVSLETLSAKARRTRSNSDLLKPRSRKSCGSPQEDDVLSITTSSRPKSDESPTAAPSPFITRRRVKSHEDEIELIFKSKRANVYTAGVSLDNRINYRPKNILKTIAQSTLISK